MQYYKRKFVDKKFIENSDQICFEKNPKETYHDFFIIFPKIYFLIEMSQRMEFAPSDYLIEEEYNLFCLAFKKTK